MTIAPLAALLLLSAASTARAADTQIVEGYVEKKTNQTKNSMLEGLHAETNRLEASMAIQSARDTYAKFYNRIRVPGFISSTPVPQLAHITGPVLPDDTSFRMGDTMYFRWAGAPLPRPGDRYATYSPAIVLQSLERPSDFEVFNAPGPEKKIPSDRRMAGYLYEMTGRVKILKISGGLVVGVVEQLSGRVGVGDELMQIPPLLDRVTPIRSGIQISAAVVCGSPVNRLSTTERSILYLNRGSRDGIRVGRVFQSIESVKTDQPTAGGAPEVSSGEATVIHVTDAYSTAIITKQFDVIRIGALLRTRQDDSPVLAKTPFLGFPKDPRVKATNEQTPETPVPPMPEIPAIDKLPNSNDETLPEPRKRPSGPPLSELDELEQNLNAKDLSPAEKNNLDKLSSQEKVGESEEPAPNLADTPGAPTVENSFGEKKAVKKDVKKKVKAKNDEEELNQLMMQN